MKTKNKIKSPKNNSLRGIGKLDWTEGSKLHSTIKRLASSFENNTDFKTRSEKKVAICKICGKKFHLNNTSKIPDHFEKRQSWLFVPKNNNLCEGSDSRTITDNYVLEEYSGLQHKIGKNYIIDFSSPNITKIILEVNRNYTLPTTLKEVTLTNVFLKRLLRKDGTEYNFTSKVVYEFNNSFKIEKTGYMVEDRNLIVEV